MCCACKFQESRRDLGASQPTIWRYNCPSRVFQALDARDAIAKSLYGSLFSWVVARINKVCGGGDGGRDGGRDGRHGKRRRNPAPARTRNRSSRSGGSSSIGILDLFGFEDLPENGFEQLCVNLANELLHQQFNRAVFRAEQAEYAREKLEWTPVAHADNGPAVRMLSAAPLGILNLLDDESNFPRASDHSFLEKCHYNHALNELYSRPRMSSMEFGVRG